MALESAAPGYRTAVEAHWARTPLMRTWNVVHMQSKMLSPAAEALRYFILEHGERQLAEHDRPLLDPQPQAGRDAG